MDEKKLKSFKYWKTQEVEDTFDIKAVKNSAGLTDWLSTDCHISTEEKSKLEALRARLEDKAPYWNEATLAFHFISPLINMIDFNSENYSTFLETKLSISLNDETINGNVDFLVATGKQIPKAPFFTLHEYKPEPNVSTDPQGQLLIAMLAAQRANEIKGIDIPLYGTYIIGRLFFFVYFYKNEYSRSKSFDATQSDIEQIFCILRKAKQYIENTVSNNLV